ncbi:MAG: hypothetical protein JO314_04660 [Acidobacteria bacterium]|nr:hypothetical protein [Acidobacteriota bacterium]
MKFSFALWLLLLTFTGSAAAQTHTQAHPSATPPTGVPVKPGTTPVPISFPWDKGEVSLRTYTNKSLGFEVTFPDTWLIPGDDFESSMKSQGFDLGLKAPDSLPQPTKIRMNAALKKVQVLLTAYRSMPGSTDNAIVRISAEDLTADPQIKDAVDYVDAVRSMYSTMHLPPDFKYSETQAEQLANGKQLAYLDTTSKEGKKRMYVTVRNSVAILFTISYTKPDDLETLRTVLGTGNFKLQ